MFGYVIPDHSQLSDEDKKTYRGFYCGVCHAIAKRFGQLPRITLTYDMAFLAIFMSSLLDGENNITVGSCIPHPLHKETYFSGPVVDYAADMNLLLAYEKLMDDWIDDHNIASYTCCMALKRQMTSVSTRYPGQTGRIHEMLLALRQNEKKRANVDVNTGNFAAIMEEVFSFPGIPDHFKERVRGFAANLGRYVYLLDAYCDLEEDKKKNRYNPLLFQDQFVVSEETIKEILLGYIGEACFQLEQLPMTEHMELIRNILYCGIWSGFYQKNRKGTKHE